MVGDNHIYAEVKRKTHFVRTRNAAVARYDKVGNVVVDYLFEPVRIQAVTVANSVGYMNENVQTARNKK